MENKEGKNWNNFVLGLVVAILPWLGLPQSWKQVLFTILGLLIALFSLARLGRSRSTAISESPNPIANDQVAEHR